MDQTTLLETAERQTADGIPLSFLQRADLGSAARNPSNEPIPARIAKILATAERLPDRISLYVPSTAGSNGNEPIPDHEFGDRTDRVCRLFADLFGGCTVTYSAGYWIDGSGSLIHERINVVTAATDPGTLADTYSQIVDLAVRYGQYWQQQSIVLDVNGDLTLINV